MYSHATYALTRFWQPSNNRVLFDGSDDRIDGDNWAAMWQSVAQEWSRPDQVPFPTTWTSETEWQQVARHAAVFLLWCVKRCVFPRELLQILDTSVIEQGMTDSRRACIKVGLQKWWEKPMDRRTQQWLNRWITNTQHRSHQSQLVPVVDKTDD